MRPKPSPSSMRKGRFKRALRLGAVGAAAAAVGWMGHLALRSPSSPKPARPPVVQSVPRSQNRSTSPRQLPHVELPSPQKIKFIHAQLQKWNVSDKAAIEAHRRPMRFSDLSSREKLERILWADRVGIKEAMAQQVPLEVKNEIGQIVSELSDKQVQSLLNANP